MSTSIVWQDTLASIHHRTSLCLKHEIQFGAFEYTTVQCMYI